MHVYFIKIQKKVQLKTLHLGFVPGLVWSPKSGIALTPNRLYLLKMHGTIPLQQEDSIYLQ